eukprot:12365331-Alexandrium_andersonii.AAC.1
MSAPRGSEGPTVYQPTHGEPGGELFGAALVPRGLARRRRRCDFACSQAGPLEPPPAVAPLPGRCCGTRRSLGTNVSSRPSGVVGNS